MAARMSVAFKYDMLMLGRSIKSTALEMHLTEHYIFNTNVNNHFLTLTAVS